MDLNAAGRYTFSLLAEKVPLQTFADSLRPMEVDYGFVSLAARLNGDASRFDPRVDVSVEDAMLHTPDLRLIIADGYAKLRVTRDGAVLNQCQAMVNRVPAGASGVVKFLPHPRAYVTVSTRSTTIKLSATRLQKGWNASLRLRRGLKQWTAVADRIIQTGTEGGFGCRAIRIRMIQGGRRDATTERLLRDLTARVSYEQRTLRLQILSAKLAGAVLRLKLGARLDGPEITALASVENADAAVLFSDLKRHTPLSGRFSSKLYWRYLAGATEGWLRFELKHGQIGPTAELGSWAGQLGLKTLDPIRFESFSGRVRFSPGSLSLERVRLLGEGLRLGADLSLTRSFVSGNLSVWFPATGLSAVSDLNRLIRFVGATGWIDLNFKIAGNLAHPRIQWLDGAFKKRVESRLAPWMRNILVQQVEKKLSEFPAH